MRTLDKAIRSYKKELKELIQKYEEELNNNGFELIYYKLTEPSKGRMYNLITAFTALLLKNNINPLEYMDEVPEYFAYGLDIKKFVIPNNVMSIGNHAFEDCSSLTSITIPDSVTIIGDFAFQGCENLKSITIPSSVTIIGDAFYNCSSLTSITIPKSVKTISYYAFDGCYNLTDVYYEGSKEDWKNIKIYTYGNKELLNANIHYNS